MIATKPLFTPVTSSEFSNPVVSFDSRGELLSSYADIVWDFSSHIHNRNVCKSRALIDFNAPLQNKTKLTCSVNKRLLSGIKEFLYVRNNVPHPRSGKVLAPQTLIAKFYAITTLINYLTLNDKDCLSKFSSEDVEPFISFVKGRNPKLAKNTLLKYLSVIEDLYHYRDKLNYGIKKHPWPNSSVIYLSNDRKKNGGRLEKQTPCIPDHLCSDLLQKSVSYLKENSKRIIFVYSKLKSELNKQHWQLLKEGKRSNALKSDRPDKHALYLASRTFSYRNLVKGTLEKYGFESKLDLNSSIVKARTCCYVVLALTTGMRNSELASLTNESLYKTTGWDDEEYLWLKGYTYKLEAEPKPAKWMVPEIAKIAINHLTEIGLIYNTNIIRSLPYLSDTERDHQNGLLHHLFIANDTTTNTFNGLSNSLWNMCLKQLAVQFNLTVKDSDNELKLPTGTVWPLTSHHFRRTFACLAARSALGDLRYLREHFKHWSLDMTLHYANDQNQDDSLFDEILTERNELQASIVSDWITTDKPVSGGRGETIATFRQRGQLQTADNLKGLVKQISNSVFVRGTGHSWCLASGDGCGGEGLYDAIQCVDCDNSVIDKSHLSTWQGIKQQNQELLALEDSGIATKQRAKLYINQADKIINKMSEIQE